MVLVCAWWECSEGVRVEGGQLYKEVWQKSKKCLKEVWQTIILMLVLGRREVWCKFGKTGNYDSAAEPEIDGWGQWLKIIEKQVSLIVSFWINLWRRRLEQNRQVITYSWQRFWWWKKKGKEARMKHKWALEWRLWVWNMNRYLMKALRLLKKIWGIELWAFCGGRGIWTNRVV